MPHPNEVQSGPDDLSEPVVYSDADQHDDPNDSDYNADKDTARRDKQPASSSSQQVNHIRQSASNAQAAAVSAAYNNIASSGDVSAKGRDLQLATLLVRNHRREADLKKRERALAEREQLLRDAEPKRSRVSNSSGSPSNNSGASADDYGLDSDILTLLGMDNDGGMDIGRSCDVASSSNGNRGKDLTLRQLGISGFANLGYVDVRVFARNNLTVRSASKLHEIKSPEEFIAAWSSYNVELQKYLLAHSRTDDVLMVTKYYGQLIRLLTDYPTQWETAKVLDTHIRSTEHTDGPIVWTVDADDDEVSQFKADIRYGHQVQLRAVPSSQRGTSSSTQRRVGSSDSTATKARRSIGICYAYNGELRPNEWSNVNHCRGKDKCKFQHRCMICGNFDHAAYETKDCAAQPRARTPFPRQK